MISQRDNSAVFTDVRDNDESVPGRSNMSANIAMVHRRRARCRTYPCPSLDLDEDVEEDLAPCRHISFPADVRFQTAVQQQDNVELAKLLSLQASKLDLNSRNHLGLTALHQGVLNRNLDTVKLLLSWGADANVQDAHGFTPMHAASADGQRNIASLLIMFGGDISIRTLAGESPVDLAKDVLTADLLMVELCKQVQHREMMERYGFAFRFIDLCERVWVNCCALYHKIVAWTRQTLEPYWTATENQSHITGKIRDKSWRMDETPNKITGH